MASARALIRRYTELNNLKPHKITAHSYRELLVAVVFHKVFVKEKEVDLAKGDFDLLRLLMARPGQVYSAEQIYARLSGDSEEYLIGNVSNVIRCRINRRRKRHRVQINPVCLTNYYNCNRILFCLK